MDVEFIHHGAREGVTGSCHELKFPSGKSLLVDIGLFQGAETSGSASGTSANANYQEVEFPIEHVEALIITHCHIDHVGRLPYLLMAGFRKPIYCTAATAHLLPMVIEDALKIGLTRDLQLIEGVLGVMERLIVPVEFEEWTRLDALDVQIRFRQAGHILGSSFVEVRLFDGHLSSEQGKRVSDPEKRGQTREKTIVFSGDLGCKGSPLLPDPASLERADVLVLESTYGDKNHENRSERQQRLQSVVERCVRDRGTVLIPAFSIGRTQELLYELEDILHRYQQQDPAWKNMLVILDSPMAAKFTEKYKVMRELWDKEAKTRVAEHRHPLDFERLHVIDSHEEHQRIVQYLKQSGDPCIVIAASGMCTGGRMLNYLKALLPDPRTDVLFVGYQAQGTPGRDIQSYGPRGGYVFLDDEKIWIKAGIHTLGGYSAHADQRELIEFVQTAEHIGQIRLVHGDAGAKDLLAGKLRGLGYEVVIP